MHTYLPRIADDELERRLAAFGAVSICGPKWCGKTTTGRQHCSSEISMADPTDDFAARRRADLDPASVIEGARPRLIDEWQEVPKLWDAVRYACDRSGEPGGFILAGSSTPRDDDRPMHSGVGRVVPLRMDTMTLSEAGVSSAGLSLRSLMAGSLRTGHSGGIAGLRGVADLVCRGGWPQAVGLSTEEAMLIAEGYVETLAESDVSRVDGVRRDPSQVRGLLASLARNESTLASLKTISADMGRSPSRNTVSQYVAALRRLYVVDDIPAWAPALRSPVRLRETPKHHLADVSLAVAAMGASPDGLAEDPKTLGLLFESLALHDLKVYAAGLGASVCHYRDDSGLEVDAIVAGKDGSWLPIEIKLGAAQVHEAERSLMRLERKMTERGERPPVAKCVIVGFGAPAHVTDLGAQVVPLDVLGP